VVDEARGDLRGGGRGGGRGPSGEEGRDAGVPSVRVAPAAVRRDRGVICSVGFLSTGSIK
jgi:hypothetical protein